MESLEDFLDLFQIDDFPASAAGDYADIRVALERKGSKIGSYDLLIAAHARHIGSTIVTNNEREFRRVPRTFAELRETPMSLNDDAALLHSNSVNHFRIPRPERYELSMRTTFPIYLGGYTA
jgi:hypothetical protein